MPVKKEITKEDVATFRGPIVEVVDKTYWIGNQVFKSKSLAEASTIKTEALYRYYRNQNGYSHADAFRYVESTKQNPVAIVRFEDVMDILRERKLLKED